MPFTTIAGWPISQAVTEARIRQRYAGIVRLSSSINEALRRVGFEIVRFPSPSSPPVRLARLVEVHQVDLVLDVGASVGNYAKGLRRNGFTGEIVSCEPLSKSWQALERSTRKDPRWHAINAVVGRSEAAATINVARNGDSSSVLPMLDLHLDAAPDSVYIGTETVACVTVDALLNQYPCRRPFLKMDVQGYEQQVLDGARESLDRIVGIQVEMSLLPLYAGQMLFRENLELLESWGFELHSVEPGFSDPRSGRLLQMDGLFFRP